MKAGKTRPTTPEEEKSSYIPMRWSAPSAPSKPPSELGIFRKRRSNEPSPRSAARRRPSASRYVGRGSAPFSRAIYIHRAEIAACFTVLLPPHLASTCGPSNPISMAATGYTMSARPPPLRNGSASTSIGWNLRNNHKEDKALYPDDNHVGRDSKVRVGPAHLRRPSDSRP